MKLLDISKGMPPIDVLEESVKGEDALLVRNGHVVMMVRAFDDEDWADWQIEHDAELQRNSRRIQAEMEQGNYFTLDELDRELDD